jgi:hypothetical protein
MDFGGAINDAAGMFNSLKQQIGGGFSQLGTDVSGALNTAGQDIGNVAQNVGQDFSNIGSQVHQDIQNFQQPDFQSPIPQSQQVAPQGSDLYGDIQRSILEGVSQIGSAVGQQNFFQSPIQFPGMQSVGPKLSDIVPQQSTAGAFFSGQPQQIPSQLANTVNQSGQMLQVRSPQDVNNIMLGMMGPGEQDVSKAVQFLRNKIQPEDVALLGRFSEMLSQSPKGEVGEIGQKVHSLAQNVFGDEAASWSNQKIANVFDTVLNQIGKGKNTAGLGLTTQTITHDGLLAFNDTNGIEPKALQGLQKDLPQAQADVLKYQDPNFYKELLPQDTAAGWLEKNSQIANHTGGPDWLANQKGFFGYVPTDKQFITPDKNFDNLVIDSRAEKQLTANGGHQEIGIIHEDPNKPGNIMVDDRHHGFTISRNMGISKMPSFIISDKGLPLDEAYQGIKDGTIAPLDFKGGIPLDQQIEQLQGTTGAQGGIPGGTGEQGLTSQDLQKLTPEYQTQEGKAKVLQTIGNANGVQGELDARFKQLDQQVSGSEATLKTQPGQLSPSTRTLEGQTPLPQGEQVPQYQPLNPSLSSLSPDVKQLLQNAPVVGRGGGRGGENILNNVKPNFQGADKDIQNLIRQSTGKYAYEANQALKESVPLTRYWEGQGKEDRLSFMQRMQQGIAQENPGDQALADHYKSKFDNTYDIGTQVKPDLAYKDDYFTKSGVWANRNEAQAFYNKFMQDKLAQTPGSFKQLQFPTIADGIKAGLSLKETNPETLYLNNYLQVRKAQIMSDFQQTAQARGYDMTRVQSVIDKYMDPGFGGSNVYRNIRQVNNVLNSVDLGLSAFHVAGTSINASVSKVSMGLNQLVTGHPIQAVGSFLRAPTAALEYAVRGNKIIGDANKGNLTPDIQNIIDAGGRLTPQIQYKGSGLEGAIRTTIDDMHNGRVLSGAVKAPLRVIGGAINEAAKPIMEYWVPRLKNGALADLIETNLKNLPEGATPEEIQAVKAEASDSIDNRFGQLVQDNLFWNKGVKDSLGLVMRSPGWNIGTVRELGLGARDLFDVQRLLSGKGFSDRAAYTLALPATTALLGSVYQYMHTGQGPQSLTDYFYPKTGQTDPNTGKEERVGFPTYMKDVYSFFHNPVQTALNKASPLASDIVKQVQGVDYRGKPIYDPQADMGTQLRQRGAAEVMAHVPFSIQSGTNRLNPTTGSTLESIMGINKAPASVTGGYYDKKSEIYSTLKPNEKQVMDYLTLSSQNGGPSGKDKASVMIKNDWAIDKMKAIQLAGNPKDLLWSKPHDQIKAYFAYQIETDPKLRAQILMQNPWIPSFAKQYSDQISQSVQQAKQNQATQQQGLTAQIGNALGVYNPQPTTPSQDFVNRSPTPQSQLTPQQVQTAAAYTALPQGSPQRQALLAQNPWLKDYWQANQDYYAQNPTQATGPLADYLRSVGIDPNVQSQNKNFGSSLSGLRSRLPIRGGGGGVKKVATGKGGTGKLSLKTSGGSLFKGLKNVQMAKAKVPKVRMAQVAKPKFLSAKVAAPKQLKAQTTAFKMPPVIKINEKKQGRHFMSGQAKFSYI